MNSTDTGTAPTISWDEFVQLEPELARFGADRLTAAPAYLATVRRSGAPRVHPVTPIFAPGGLFLFMEPTSPKGTDLRERGWFALHNGVPDNEGSGPASSTSEVTGSPWRIPTSGPRWPARPAFRPPTATSSSSCA